MSENSERLSCDVLIIGCGIAGATAALRLSENEKLRIMIITKSKEPEETNTRYAQGGIIYEGNEDSPEQLAADLFRAGDDINNREAVDILAHEGPQLVRQLLVDEYAVPFTMDENNLLERTREAAHSTSRILHVNDSTGNAIERALMHALKDRPNVHILTQHVAIDLLTPAHHSTDPRAVYEPLSCVGAYAYDLKNNKTITVVSKVTILATGGLGQIFLHTSNPDGATGDGLAMAYRAGARIINAEYVQFHPTIFYYRGEAQFLISEALRGEGAHLLNAKGEPFMYRYAPQGGDLAPRDEVARGIHQEMLTTGTSSVFLDIASVMPADKIKQRFPTIYESCMKFGVDPTQEPIPVVPAAHYFCGGVWVDKWGRTSLQRLYAAGEVSCTGVHGANRLGSASLLEGLVWGYRAARNIAVTIDGLDLVDDSSIPEWSDKEAIDPADPALIKHDMATIRHTMWYYVGVIRSTRRLRRALSDLNTLGNDIDAFYRTTRLEESLISLRHAALAAQIVARAAWENRTSHGCHYRED